MIVYFADRQLNILGQASTELPDGLIISDDLKTEDIETGVAVFDCKVHFDPKNRAKVEEYTEVGNYILRSEDGENEFYQIIESEIDTKKQQVYIYAEDNGMDLLNEVAGKYEADKAYPITHYINKYAAGAGFVIGVNEAKDLTRKLSWDGESTAAARIASIATQFDGCEISFSFDIDGLMVVKRYINIYKERGKDIGVTLRLNQDIDKIIVTKSIANLATALQCTGDTPEDENTEDDIDPVPITLEGYSYDDGDFYVENGLLKSRQALKRWSRLLWKDDDTQKSGGHIVKPFSYETLSQQELCSRGITELKKIRDMEINYEVEISKFPDNVKIGDRINIVDDVGELYVSTRILKLETSVAEREKKATLGEYLIKSSGIHAKVAELAAEFAKYSVSAKRALSIASNAKALADTAKNTANSALTDSQAAQTAADEAKAAATTANQSAAEANTKADNAQAAVEIVENSVTELETTVTNAKNTADNAQQAAQTAQSKADEAAQAAANAQAEAADANAAVEIAQGKAETAITKAAAAQTAADTAKTDAATAQQTAAAAKQDAEKANADIVSLGGRLDTVSNTMQADYARKTDLTEATASLQTQITQNAGQIEATASRVQNIDETANNAQEQAEAAQTAADNAKAQAEQATANAQTAQNKADEAATAAANAQSEANTAKAAAATAKSIADKAESDLAAAKADLDTVTNRVGATEEEIATAQLAVEAAQTAADKAKADASTATEKATTAQQTADKAVTDAYNAQAAANDAAGKANLAQQAADQAKGDAAAAQSKADEAAETAAEAQRTADTAKTNAATAQTKANEAATAAANAQKAADDADAKAAQAATDLATAQQNLANVTSRVDATEEEVAAAQQAVNTAQAAADKAKQDAQTAQQTADTAKANAANAQTAANNAKTAADNAQAAAEAAQADADAAQEAVNALSVRVTTAETKITQNSEQISLMATKKEVTQTFGGYYTKAETDSAISVKANEITSNVKSQITGLEIGGKNLIYGTGFGGIPMRWERITGDGTELGYHAMTDKNNGNNTTGQYLTAIPVHGQRYTLSARIRGKANIVLYRISDGGNSPIQWLTKDDISETEYTKHSITFEPHKEQLSGIYIVTMYGEENTPVGDWFEIEPDSLKLELGDKATDWTLCPDELTEADRLAQETADDAISKVTSAESIIQQLSDSISMLVGEDDNGASLVTQTADGWTFATGDIKATAEKARDDLADLANKFVSTENVVSFLQTSVEDITAKTNYVNIGTYNNEPCIELGASDSEYKVLITNTQILFQVGSATPTRIDTDGLVSENVTVENELRQKNKNVTGYWAWTVRANGNYGPMWHE